MSLTAGRSGTGGRAKPGTGGGWVENAAPRRGLPPLQIGHVWRYRELIVFFAQRDIKVRYKQAFLGILWAGLNPLLGALTFTLLFHHLADIEIEGTSYFAFSLAGYVGWTYFATAVSAGTSSLLVNAQLLTKVAFPRLVAPVASLLPPLVDLAVGMITTLVVAVVVGDGLSALGLLIWLPLGIVLLVLAAVGPVLFFSASVVRYRDVAVFVTFALQFLLFASPVAYPPTLIPEAWRVLYYANPVAGALGLLRSGLVNTDLPSAPSLALSGAVAIMLLFVGLLHFRRNERQFADLI